MILNSHSTVRTVRTLARLRALPGSPESLLFANVKIPVSHGSAWSNLLLLDVVVVRSVLHKLKR